MRRSKQSTESRPPGDGSAVVPQPKFDVSWKLLSQFVVPVLSLPLPPYGVNQALQVHAQAQAQAQRQFNAIGDCSGIRFKYCLVFEFPGCKGCRRDGNAWPAHSRRCSGSMAGRVALLDAAAAMSPARTRIIQPYALVISTRQLSANKNSSHAPMTRRSTEYLHRSIDRRSQEKALLINELIRPASLHPITTTRCQPQENTNRESSIERNREKNEDPYPIPFVFCFFASS